MKGRDVIGNLCDGAEERAEALESQVQEGSKNREKEVLEWKDKLQQVTAVAEQDRAERESLLSVGSNSQILQDALETAKRQLSLPVIRHAMCNRILMMRKHSDDAQAL